MFEKALPALPIDPGDGLSEGVRTTTVRNWREFVELMTKSEMLKAGLIWRGQRRGDSPGWALRPRLDRGFIPSARDLPEDPDPDDIDRARLTRHYRAQLARFKAASAGRRGVNPRNLDGLAGEEDQDDEWWALGQHYGLDTPFLDWTESPFAALFFAYLEEEAQAGESFRYVFALDRAAIEKWNAVHLDDRKRSLAFVPIQIPAHVPEDPDSVLSAEARRLEYRRERLYFPKIRIVRPRTDENLRLLSQGGVFTQGPPGRDIEGFVRETFRTLVRPALTADGDPRPSWMLKVRVMDKEPSERRECLIALNRMAINHRTLFPDLVGASQFVNMSLADPSY